MKTSEEAITEEVDYYGSVKTRYKEIFLAALEKLVNEWMGGYHIVIKSTPRVTDDRPLRDIVYKYNSQKVLVFITTEWAGSTDPGYPYLSCFPDNHTNVSIRPSVRRCVLGRHFNACIEIENHNRMRQSYLELEECWVTQSGYFRLATTVVLGTGTTDAKLPFCRGIS